MARIGIVALIGLFGLSAVLAIAGPASAAPPSIPDGGTLGAVTCTYLEPAEYHSLGTAPTGEAQPAGPGVSGDTSFCAGQAIFDPVTGFAYFLGYPDYLSRPQRLQRLDPATGAISDLGAIPIPPGKSFVVYSIFMDDRVAKVVVEDRTEGSTGTFLVFDIDLSTGALSDPVPISSGDGSSLIGLVPWASAFDPSTDRVFVLDQLGTLFTLDSATGVLTKQATLAIEARDGATQLFTMAIASDGTTFILQFPPSSATASTPVLYATTVAHPALDLQRLGAVTLAGRALPVDGLFIVPGTPAQPAPAPVPTQPSASPAPIVTPAAAVQKPELASTGADAQQTLLFASVGGGVLLLGAGLLVAGRMRRGRSNG